MNKLLEQAMFYKRLGITSIPILRKDKLPEFHWREWCDKIPPYLYLRNWFDDDRKNIAILCGGVNNLIVLDFDNMDVYYEWHHKCFQRKDEWHDVCTYSYKVKTGRGIHVYVKTPERIMSRKLKIGVDIKSHGTYVLVPPSVHPNGTVYQGIGEFHIMAVSNIGDVIDIPPMEMPKKMEINWDIDYDRYMKSEDDPIALIKSTVKILDYCNKLTQMKCKSNDGRYWYGRCVSPNHEDLHPSFVVDTKNNVCTCLSPRCTLNEDKGIDVIELHARLYNMSTKDAIHDLYNTISASVI